MIAYKGSEPGAGGSSLVWGSLWEWGSVFWGCRGLCGGLCGGVGISVEVDQPFPSLISPNPNIAVTTLYTLPIPSTPSLHTAYTPYRVLPPLTLKAGSGQLQ